MGIVLYGFPKSGKTTIGHLVAERLSRPFFDTDALILAQHPESASIRDLYQTIGETKFRIIETAVIEQLAAMHNAGHLPPAIIALGGGAPLNPTNVKLLYNVGKWVFLDVPLAVIRDRFLKTSLPTYLPSFDALDALYTTRRAVYTSIPHQIATCESDVLSIANF
jgi:shikimate kinase